MNNVQQTVFLAIERALNEGQHAKDCACWKIIISTKTRDELAGGAADSYVRALELREEACTCYRKDLAAALDLVKGYPPADAGVCRECGCTEEHACIDTETGTPCAWADETMTLCTVCEKALKLQELTDEVNWFCKASIGLVCVNDGKDPSSFCIWLGTAINSICTRSGGRYIYEAISFLERSLEAGSAEARCVERMGSSRVFLTEQLLEAAKNLNIQLPQSPDAVPSRGIIDPAPAKDNIDPVGPVVAEAQAAKTRQAS